MARVSVRIEYQGGQLVSAIGIDCTCDRCGSGVPKDAPIIAADNSDGEAGALIICQPCVEKMWSEAIDLQRVYQGERYADADCLVSVVRD